MEGARVGIRPVALGAVSVMLALVMSGCVSSSRAAGELCAEGPVPDVRVSGEVPPTWADRWISRAGGSLAGGSVAPGVDDDGTFDRVYSCVGLVDGMWTPMVMGGSAPSQRAVRVGVDDYLYRAGDVTVANKSYSVDIVVAQYSSDGARFGVAFSPMLQPRSFDDVFSGAYVVQRMREGGVF